MSSSVSYNFWSYFPAIEAINHSEIGALLPKISERVKHTYNVTNIHLEGAFQETKIPPIIWYLNLKFECSYFLSLGDSGYFSNISFARAAVNLYSNKLVFYYRTMRYLRIMALLFY
jgi:hypothetical protein